MYYDHNDTNKRKIANLKKEQAIANLRADFQHQMNNDPAESGIEWATFEFYCREQNSNTIWADLVEDTLDDGMAIEAADLITDEATLATRNVFAISEEQTRLGFSQANVARSHTGPRDLNQVFSKRPPSYKPHDSESPSEQEICPRQRGNLESRYIYWQLPLNLERGVATARLRLCRHQHANPVTTNNYAVSGDISSNRVVSNLNPDAHLLYCFYVPEKRHPDVRVWPDDWNGNCPDGSYCVSCTAYPC